MLPAIIGGVATIGSALIGGHGQAQANAANAHQAQQNRDFQERMRATQYQTAVEDMRKAGLNPALAYQQGGAGNVSGATATAQNTAAGAADSAAAAINTFQQMRATAAQIDKTNAETAKVKAEDQILREINYPVGSMDRDVKRNTYVDTVQRIRAESRSSISSAKEAEASAELRQLALPEAQAIAAFYRSIMGKASPYVTGAAGVLGALSRLRQFRR